MEEKFAIIGKQKVALPFYGKRVEGELILHLMVTKSGDVINIYEGTDNVFIIGKCAYKDDIEITVSDKETFMSEYEKNQESRLKLINE